jgi:3-phosphoshikimate 1-carboxyvinyltransferase
MADNPDLVPTVAALAAFAQGTTTIRNVPHLRIKESDRIKAIYSQWNRIGITTRELEDGMVIEGKGSYSPGTLSSHGDHRIAMAIALLGSTNGGLWLEGEEAVEKSFPNFWGLWDRL